MTTINSTVKSWWDWLEKNKKDRAEIKRCGTIEEILLLPGFYKLKQLVDKTEDKNKIDNPHLALISGITARIEEWIPKKDKEKEISLAGLMGKGKDDDKPVSQIRFRKLLQTNDVNELYPKLMRVLPLIKHKANLGKLVTDLRYWNERTRRQWAEDYYMGSKSEESDDKTPEIKGEK